MQLLDSRGIGSVHWKKSRRTYVCMYIVHVADITISFCELASIEFNFPLHELDCDWTIPVRDSRTRQVFLDTSLTIGHNPFRDNLRVVHWYRYWTSIYSRLSQFNSHRSLRAPSWFARFTIGLGYLRYWLSYVNRSMLLSRNEICLWRYQLSLPLASLRYEKASNEIADWEK